MKSMLMLRGFALLVLQRLLLCVTFAFCGTAWADPEKPPPQSILDSLPPLPLPTEQQLQRGREMLDKIVYVVDNVSLTDAAAVLKVFGFTDLRTDTYPTHTWVGPRGKNSHFAQPQEMVGMGISDIVVNPWIENPRHNNVARLTTTIVPSEACVSIEDVRRVFAPRASSVSRSPVVYTHPIELPRRVHRTGNLTFSLRQNPFNQNASITFGFEYQTCSNGFGFTYRTATKEASK